MAEPAPSSSGTRLLVTLALLSPVLVAWACFTPELGPAPFLCTPVGLCPEGYDCVTGVCVKRGVGVVPLDMQLVDVPPPPDLPLDVQPLDVPPTDGQVTPDPMPPPPDVPVDLPAPVDLVDGPVAVDMPPDLPVSMGSPRDVVINEVGHNANAGSTRLESQHEFVELYNKGNGNVDLSGWVLGDNSIDSAPLFTFPSGIVLPPRSFLVVYDGGLDPRDLPQPTGSCAYRLSGSKWSAQGALANGGDVVSLYRSASLSAQNLVDFMAYSTSGTVATPATDDTAVGAGLWASDKAAVVQTANRASVALIADGQSPNETSDPARDWAQYPAGTEGTPCAAN